MAVHDLVESPLGILACGDEGVSVVADERRLISRPAEAACWVGEELLVLSRGAVLSWRPGTEPTERPTGFWMGATALAASETGVVIAGDETIDNVDKEVRWFEPESWAVTARVAARKWVMALAPRDRRVALGTWDGKIHVVDLDDPPLPIPAEEIDLRGEPEAGVDLPAPPYAELPRHPASVPTMPVRALAWQGDRLLAVYGPVGAGAGLWRSDRPDAPVELAGALCLAVASDGRVALGGTFGIRLLDPDLDSSTEVELPSRAGTGQLPLADVTHDLVPIEGTVLSLLFDGASRLHAGLADGRSLSVTTATVSSRSHRPVDGRE